MISFNIFLLFVLLSSVSCEVCTETEMIFNGNFSQPKLFSPWNIIGYLPGGPGVWSSVPSQNGFDLWAEGSMNSPAKLSTGAPTGQHLDINGNSKWAQISYEFNAPCLLGSTEATYSFEYWFNEECGCDSLQFTIQQQGKQIVSETYKMQSDGWMSANGSFKLLACQPLKLSFTSNAKGNAGVHIDSVSVKAKQCSGVELVSGGDFNAPAISGAWEKVSFIPSGEGIWATTSVYVLWQEGALGSPTKGTKGKPIGQFLEINGESTKAQVGYKFFTPFLLGSAESTLSFQYWIRQSGEGCECSNVNYFGYTIEQGGKTVKSAGLDGSKSGWVAVSVTVDLKPALPAHVYFTTDTAKIGGVHIDSVSVTVTERRDGVVDPKDNYDVAMLEMIPTNKA
eukprot:TRINITY_DN2129_c0_g1_i4.p2 TRINITY_DN2129_c0_g1~~TRINITY_DN2129_c0_g1_i4.p2  ORF type:complete len:395 (+),score=75.78 TRINITY_DN2129_c0_g1_i4:107-1291(+)